MVEDRLAPWFYQHVSPLLKAYFACDLEHARKMYSAAAETLAQEEDEDWRHAFRLRLESSWVFVLFELGVREEAARAYREFMELIALPLPGPVSARLAAVSELLTRLNADVCGHDKLTTEDVARLSAAVPDDLRGPNYWHQLACWAFLHGERQIMEGAYNYFLAEGSSGMEDWMLFRLRLMRKLMDRQASAEDVITAIQGIELRVQLADFEWLLLAACREQGLITEEVQLALEDAEYRLSVRGEPQLKRG